MGRLHRTRWAAALTGLLDDELDPRRVARVWEHLERCPDCLRELEELIRLQQSLRRLADAR